MGDLVKSLMREGVLAIQARSGYSPAVLVWGVIALLGSLLALSFFCVAVYVWLASRLGGINAALILAWLFLALAAVAALLTIMARRSAMQRAVLERATRPRPVGAWMLDPNVLGVAASAGRRIGWQRAVPLALLGLVALNWARDHNRVRSGRCDCE